MNSTPRRAFGSTDQPRRSDVSLDLTTARKMLPLVRQIVGDILAHRQTLNRLQPEQENLDRHRRDLVWQERQRRYYVTETIEATEKALAAALKELRGLGVNLTDSATGEVEFPTRINGKSASFQWRAGEDDLHYWHYADEDGRRPIPQDWAASQPVAQHS
ncbi:DUF2203 family protein [Tuwongella immobilis]|uniref:DUF2203 domain-containing protein n=1 Tax=Tuwongella immobilis TaxID=692036 RepID=A0A6C2YSX3_9BACT|nr:DUF2203 family protein [Tuwongella immobilis]VIP04035.1 Uncharacterized protein OS=Planctomyces limnophilus (strain ATCC 43296 / DSM 3776 / IFAM 1008 / 290) GN=Plim_1332 PE=4 SV=1: DUF2203 [Tuwongella immobilis]VTS05437.1 Uncharacterized protein OS=Planctomyces limnophilus (strain ATCC 43296 / DSM 3776 / IFAM 1008 / 290) GN=Plim_1332 PE=4 SV=1: DUF2203 [Tuwongella immobilis]